MARTATVYLLSGDYAERLGDLYQAARAAQADTTPRTLSEEHPYDVLRQEYDDLKAEAIANGVTVELTAVGRQVWRDLKKKHPPRIEGDGVDADTAKADRVAGANVESIEDDLVHASVTSPQFSSRAAFDEWADTLSEGEWQTVLVKAWELATGARFDPKSLPVSPTPSSEPS